jgi:transcriptional regulator with GAF, ATPase, and Fis domain
VNELGSVEDGRTREDNRQTRRTAADPKLAYPDAKKAEGITSILAVPIKTKERVIGVLRLYSKAVRHCTLEEIKLVTALAYLGGLTIQNASLYLMCQTEMKALQEEL